MMDWEGQTVVDRDGEKIGKIEEIFLVEETGKPEWALVKLGRLKGHTTLVPLTSAHHVKDGVAIHVRKDDVSEAPAIKPDAEPSEQEVEALYRHYGLSAPNGSGGSSGATPGNANGGSGPAQPAASAYFRDSSPPAQSMPAATQPGPPSGAPSGRDLRDAPVGDILQTVKQEGSNLVSQEMRLAKAEMTEKAKDVGIGAGMFGGAGYVANLAGVALMITLILGLAEAMDAWLAALIVTVLFAAIAGVLALSGKKKIQQAGPPIPQQTVESVKQTVQTVKEEAKWGLGQTR